MQFTIAKASRGRGELSFCFLKPSRFLAFGTNEINICARHTVSSLWVTANAVVSCQGRVTAKQTGKALGYGAEQTDIRAHLPGPPFRRLSLPSLACTCVRVIPGSKELLLCLAVGCLSALCLALAWVRSRVSNCASLAHRAIWPSGLLGLGCSHSPSFPIITQFRRCCFPDLPLTASETSASI